MTKRPIGVTLLAMLSIIGIVVAVYRTLQALGLFPLSFGPFEFYNLSIFAAFMYGLLALIWVWVFQWLWAVDPRGWMFAAVLTTLNIIFDFIAVIGGTAWEYILPSLAINTIILIYCLLPGTKAAFGVDEMQAQAEAARAAAAAQAAQAAAAQAATEE
ncbi:hypothetical protein ACFLYO_07465 [Chloroflexota bacterium]